MAQRVAAKDPASTALKALDIIEHLASSRAGLGLNELSRRLDSSRGSVLRILHALQRRRLVRQDGSTKQYRLTLRLLELGALVLDRMEIQDIARPQLQRLSQLSGETAHLGILDGWDIVFVGKAEPANPLRLHSRVGYRVRSHCTALGKVLLADLPPERWQEYIADCTLTPMTPRTIVSSEKFLSALAQVRTSGYAIDAEEHRAGITCIGAPVRGHSGQAVAAVSISGPAFRMTAEAIPALTRLVCDAASDISTELGYSTGEVR